MLESNWFAKGRLLVPLERRSKILAYTVVLINASMDNINVAGSLTSAFSISEKFGANTTTVSWVFSSYALTLGAFVIIAGKLADIFGSDKVFLAGLVFQSISALITAAIEKQIVALIVFRAIQGIFSATLIPAAFAITGNYFRGPTLAKAVTFLLIAVTASMGVGLILGGAFSQSSIGYKGLYYTTFAISMASFLFLYFFMIPIDPTEEHKKLKIKNLDFGGSALLVAGLILMILGLTEGGESWHRPSSYIPLAIGILVTVFVIGFEMIYIQKFKDNANRQLQHLKNNHDSVEEVTMECLPKIAKDWRYNLELLFPREVSKVPNFFQYVLSSFLYYMCLISVISTDVQYNQYVTLDTPLIAALKALPVSLGLVLGSSVYRHHIAQRAGIRLVLVSSALIALTMSIWVSRLDFRTSNNYWKYECFGLLFFGYGINLYFQVLWNDYAFNTPLHLQGVVSGILQTSGQIGICFGNTIIATMGGDIEFSKNFDHRVKLHYDMKKNFYLVFAGCAASFLILLTVKRGKEKDEGPEEQEIEMN